MYNAEKYVGNCIDILLQENLDEHAYEIIVMDERQPFLIRDPDPAGNRTGNLPLQR